MNMIIDNAAKRTEAAKLDIRAIVNPQSVAIIGFSSKPGTAGQVVMNNLLNGGYTGELHLVGRSGGELNGRKILSGVDELPHGIHLAILVLPSEAVLQTVKDCVSKGVKGAVCFASGFAEMGEVGRQQQHEIGEVARAGGMALLGPNTVGYFNYVDAFYVMMVDLVLPPRLNRADGPAVAIVAQSGGIGNHVAASLAARGVPISYMMTTGNEAQLGLAEMLEFFAEDPSTGTIAIYAEQIRSAKDFTAAVQRARAKDKHVVLLHPGRSERSREAAQSHTGALAGNHAAMRLMAEHAGVVVVDSLEEIIDVSQILLRFPAAPTGGLGLVTASGAICGLAQDYVEPLLLEMPPLAAEQVEALKEHLPVFLPPRNPLDIGTLVSVKPELIQRGVEAILADPAVGSTLVSIPMPGPEASVAWLKYFIEGVGSSAKPSIFVLHNEDVPLSAQFLAEAKLRRAVVLRSPERALRALARVTQFGRRQVAKTAGQQTATPKRVNLSLGKGTQAEWAGKIALREIGIQTPPGVLVSSLQEALAVVEEIGYPVVIKAQSSALAHKSEVGGVLLNIADDRSLANAWEQLHQNVSRGAPDLKLDGVLIEKMGARGLELVVGASRDSQWGPILMVGLGGVWVEALGDVQLLPPDLPHAVIVERLRDLKASKLLTGFRGSEPVDLDAVAEVVQKLGALMLSNPEIIEVDVNPLVVYPKGSGVVALDALFVTEE
jgi:acyl-CoA synthetase (NDP forming)